VKNKLLIQCTVLAGLTLIPACSPRTLTTTLNSTPKSIEGDKPYTIVETSYMTSITDITQDSVTTIALETTNEATATFNTTGIVQSTALLATTSILNTTEPTLLDVTKISQPILIADKFKFSEGPVWDRMRNVLLFSDIDANRIYQLVLPNAITVFREPSNKSNGLAFDMQGRLLAAEHVSRSITRTLADGSVETLASNYMGKQLNSPNDIVVRSDGTIYFTDPTYGLEKRPPGVEYMGLYRISPKGELFLEGKFDKSPNGVALSPDQKILYLALTGANEILAFDINADGATSNRRTFINVPQPDGMTVDIAGNLYIAGLQGIYIFSSDGDKHAIVNTSKQPTNCEFGGLTGNILFITAREALYFVELPIPGFKSS
jgi:gluconolactonase